MVLGYWAEAICKAICIEYLRQIRYNKTLAMCFNNVVHASHQVQKENDDIMRELTKCKQDLVAERLAHKILQEQDNQVGMRASSIHKRVCNRT